MRLGGHVQVKIESKDYASPEREITGSVSQFLDSMIAGIYPSDYPLKWTVFVQ